MLVIFDLEVTAWEGSMARRWSGPGEHPEIIQIGAVRLDEDLRETAAFDVLVRPALNPRLSDYIVRLTGITQDELDRRGVPIGEALTRFGRFAEGAKRVLSNGGDADWIRRNIALAGLDRRLAALPFGSLAPHFRRATASGGHVTSSSLPGILGFTMAGRAHDGLADARAIAGALQRTLPAGGLAALLAAIDDGDP